MPQIFCSRLLGERSRKRLLVVRSVDIHEGIDSTKTGSSDRRSNPVKEELDIVIRIGNLERSGANLIVRFYSTTYA
jgi:hypothetical protein